jgi:hypothetical protein
VSENCVIPPAEPVEPVSAPFFDKSPPSIDEMYQRWQTQVIEWFTVDSKAVFAVIMDVIKVQLAEVVVFDVWKWRRLGGLRIVIRQEVGRAAVHPNAQRHQPTGVLEDGKDREGCYLPTRLKREAPKLSGGYYLA